MADRARARRFRNKTAPRGQDQWGRQTGLISIVSGRRPMHNWAVSTALGAQLTDQRLSAQLITTVYARQLVEETNRFPFVPLPLVSFMISNGNWVSVTISSPNPCGKGMSFEANNNPNLLILFAQPPSKRRFSDRLISGQLEKDLVGNKEIITKGIWVRLNLFSSAYLLLNNIFSRPVLISWCDVAVN